MHKVSSFNPISDSNSKILILGSIPGIASLQANQYYAHPRNAFWPIMSAIYEFDVISSYEERQEALKTASVAVWDVLQSCLRAGSLDSSIQKNSRIPNDFSTFFKHHPHIRLIAFNGSEAERCFQKIVMPTLNIDDVTLLKLPSTSPAHTMPFKEKLIAWQAIKATRD